MKPWYQWYDRVPTVLQDPNETLVDRLVSHCHYQPNNVALYYFGTSFTWNQLTDRVKRIAHSLAQMGVKRGDRVAVMLQNMPAFWDVQFAVWWLGAIVVPINIMYRDAELRHHLTDSGATVVVALDSVADRVVGIQSDTGVTTIIGVPDAFDLTGSRPSVIPDTVPVSGAVPYGDLLKASPLSDPPASVGLDAVAYLNYTSGTTGVAKGAMNTHRNVMVNAEVYVRWTQMGPGDVNVVFAPLFHITGSISGIAASVYAGIPAVLLYRFEPGLALEAIQRHRGTFTVGSITTYLAMLNHPRLESTDLSSFIKAYSGGAPVSPATVERFRQATGQYIYNVYGLTESTSPATMVPWRTPARVDPASGALSVGVPVPGLDARIVKLDDPEQDEIYGVPGQLLLKGPQIVPGYWNRPAETAKSRMDDWFLTGDVATMDADGWIYIVDRLKDMIVASGYKVWPREVEDVLYQHPAVREATVVGVPDPYRGETVKAFVALRDDVAMPTPDDLIQYVRTHLAAYKVPREIDIVSEVPKTASGKFLRRVLREQERAKMQESS